MDNGIGIDASLKLRGDNIIEHQSKGMLLIRKRIEALNAENNNNKDKYEKEIELLKNTQNKKTNYDNKGNLVQSLSKNDFYRDIQKFGKEFKIFLMKMAFRFLKIYQRRA